MMQKLWNKLNPNKKRAVVVIVGVAGLFAVVSLFSGKSGQTHKSTNRQDTIRHVLTDRNTRDIGIDSLSADLKIVSDDNKALRRELAQVIKELEQTKQDATSSSKVDQELTNLRQDLNTLLRQPDPANIKKTMSLESWAKPRGMMRQSNTIMMIPLRYFKTRQSLRSFIDKTPLLTVAKVKRSNRIFKLSAMWKNPMNRPKRKAQAHKKKKFICQPVH